MAEAGNELLDDISTENKLKMEEFDVNKTNCDKLENADSNTIENADSNENECEKKKEKHVFAVPTLPSNKVIDSKSSIKEESKTKTGFPLDEPVWGGVAEHSDPPYSLTVLKDGIVKETVDLSKKSRYIFGRNDDCDVQTEHPSCSRYHAVLQYCLVEKDMRKKGFYIYDTGSTHGTILNKVKIKAKIYNRVRVGYQLKFGGSTRLYIIEVINYRGNK